MSDSSTLTLSVRIPRTLPLLLAADPSVSTTQLTISPSPCHTTTAVFEPIAQTVAAPTEPIAQTVAAPTLNTQPPAEQIITLSGPSQSSSHEPSTAAAGQPLTLSQLSQLSTIYSKQIQLQLAQLQQVQQQQSGQPLSTAILQCVGLMQAQHNIISSAQRSGPMGMYQIGIPAQLASSNAVSIVPQLAVPISTPSPCVSTQTTPTTTPPTTSESSS